MNGPWFCGHHQTDNNECSWYSVNDSTDKLWCWCGWQVMMLMWLCFHMGLAKITLRMLTCILALKKSASPMVTDILSHIGCKTSMRTCLMVCLVQCKNLFLAWTHYVVKCTIETTQCGVMRCCRQASQTVAGLKLHGVSRLWETSSWQGSWPNTWHSSKYCASLIIEICTR